MEAAFIKADVRREEEVSGLIDETLARFGRIDIAVNNAGAEGLAGPIVDQTIENYVATFETNVLGTLLSLKHEMRVMQAQRHGCIITMARSASCHRRGAPCLGSSIPTRPDHFSLRPPHCRQGRHSDRSHRRERQHGRKRSRRRTGRRQRRWGQRPSGASLAHLAVSGSAGSADRGAPFHRYKKSRAPKRGSE